MHLRFLCNIGNTVSIQRTAGGPISPTGVLVVSHVEPDFLLVPEPAQILLRQAVGPTA